VGRRIALVDHTTQHRPGAGVLAAIAEALTTQVNRDVAPAWGVAPCTVAVGGKGDQIHVFDSAHQAAEFGWHSVDDHGLPYAHVFVEGSLAVGSDWLTGDASVSSTLSHEALELLVDPGANQYAFDGDRELWATEICDPVQATTYVIEAGSVRVPVSDFVLPAFFNPWAAGPWDHRGELEGAFTLATGGYAVVERASATTERQARRFEVRFDPAVPEATRQRKLEGFGRTYWRLALQP
jgi:hypothetical protein